MSFGAAVRQEGQTAFFQAGCKDLNVGDAYISSKHANFIINTKNASATHIEELGQKVMDKVFKKFGIKLEWEIKIIGNK